jgi:SAM-dependent methyltransferase
MTQSTDEWWQGLYDDVVADVLLERADENEVHATLGFLTHVLELRAGDVVFDQCCGIGSLALPLAGRGYSLIGVEQSASYVERAQRRARVRDLDCRFHAADAFEFVPVRRCSAAFNWWTSFGYADTDAENARMLARAYESLAPGGRFALDTMNLTQVLRGFSENVVVRRQTPEGEVVLTRRSVLDLPKGRLLKTWSFELSDGSRTERPSSVRLYLPHSLVELFESVGFREIRCFGSVKGEPIALDSPRLIVVGRKPEMELVC